VVKTISTILLVFAASPRPLAVIIVALSLLTACGRLPEIVQDPARPVQPSEQLCRSLFPQGEWQLQHAIAATVKGRKMGRLMGAMVVDAPKRAIRCALMTIEGLVLFSARYDGRITVERAVKPFDRPGFAGGLIDDLMLVFLAPEGQAEVGRTTDREVICRYPGPQGLITDIFVKDPDRRRIHRYDARGRLLRSVSVERQNGAPCCDGTGIAQHIILESRSGDDYRLEMRLVEAVPLTKETP
jgi:hypothetical protein